MATILNKGFSWGIDEEFHQNCVIILCNTKWSEDSTKPFAMPFATKHVRLIAWKGFGRGESTLLYLWVDMRSEQRFRSCGSGSGDYSSIPAHGNWHIETQPGFRPVSCLILKKPTGWSVKRHPSVAPHNGENDSEAQESAHASPVVRRACITWAEPTKKNPKKSR